MYFCNCVLHNFTALPIAWPTSTIFISHILSPHCFLAGSLPIKSCTWVVRFIFISTLMFHQNCWDSPCDLRFQQSSVRWQCGCYPHWKMLSLITISITLKRHIEIFLCFFFSRRKNSINEYKLMLIWLSKTLAEQTNRNGILGKGELLANRTSSQLFKYFSYLQSALTRMLWCASFDISDYSVSIFWYDWN